MRTINGVALGVVAVAAGSAWGTIISGSVSWTDTGGVTHGMRGVDVWVIEENPMLGSSPIGFVSANDAGLYSATVFFRPGATGYSVVPFASNGSAFVSSDATAANTYGAFSFFPGTLPFPGGSNVVTPVGAVSNNAFSILDAMYTGQYWGSHARSPAAPPLQIPVLYPRSVAGSRYVRPASAGAGFPLGRLEIGPGHQNDWDVLEHEYSHYLENLDGLTASPGGAHSSGVSSIPALGKNAGSRLAWGEGFATWSGVASNNYDPAGQTMPLVPNTGDTIYTDTSGATAFSRNLETPNTANQGEGDEAAVYRILWDLADPANEPHDRVSIGFTELYGQIRAMSIPVVGGGPDRHPNTLADIWNHSVNLGTDIRTIVDYGAIFQQYGVSPAPAFSDQVLIASDPAPTFDWFAQNNGANEHFRLLFLDSTLDTVVWSKYVDSVTTYTLTPAEWLFFQDHPADYRLVIAGADLWVDGTMTPHPVGDESGYYWSDAYGFEVLVPSPGALGLGMLAAACRVRRRRP
ncbi:MAG TPA: hypothetical protein VHN77_13225 [Phycisphaerales bacterium]|nr:hypothetical protein [Phycisphaerales bacterium]